MEKWTWTSYQFLEDKSKIESKKFKTVSFKEEFFTLCALSDIDFTKNWLWLRQNYNQSFPTTFSGKFSIDRVIGAMTSRFFNGGLPNVSF